MDCNVAQGRDNVMSRFYWVYKIHNRVDDDVEVVLPAARRVAGCGNRVEEEDVLVMNRRLKSYCRSNDWVPISGVYISTDDYESYTKHLEAKGDLYRVVEETRDLHPAYASDEMHRTAGRGRTAVQMLKLIGESDRHWSEIIQRREVARKEGRLMFPETLRRTNLKALFETLEDSLAASSTWSKEAFFKSIAWTKRLKDPASVSDEQVFDQLVVVTFFSGIRANMVTKRIKRINELLHGYQRVKGFTQEDMSRFLDDPGTIHHEQKLRACIANAKALDALVRQYGSFARYLEGFGPTRLLDLRDDLRRRFRYLGERTVYHFMMELGLPVLKPDRVVSLILTRLNLIDDTGQIDQAIQVGKAFVDATGYPIRYIDIVLVMYGQAENDSVGIAKGVCLGKAPRCSACGITSYCVYFRNQNNLISQPE